MSEELKAIITKTQVTDRDIWGDMLKRRQEINCFFTHLKQEEMSLDITLKDPTATYDATLYETNITNNLVTMADRAGLYDAIWRPDSIGAKTAKEIIEPVNKGLKALIDKPDYFKQFNAPNGWGKYRTFVPFVSQYLEALKKYPDALIEVCR